MSPAKCEQIPGEGPDPTIVPNKRATLLWSDHEPDEEELLDGCDLEVVKDNPIAKMMDGCTSEVVKNLPIQEMGDCDLKAVKDIPIVKMDDCTTKVIEASPNKVVEKYVSEHEETFDPETPFKDGQKGEVICKNDREVVQAAVKQAGDVLQHISSLLHSSLNNFAIIFADHFALLTVLERCLRVEGLFMLRHIFLHHLIGRSFDNFGRTIIHLHDGNIFDSFEITITHLLDGKIFDNFGCASVHHFRDGVILDNFEITPI